MATELAAPPAIPAMSAGNPAQPVRLRPSTLELLAMAAGLCALLAAVNDASLFTDEGFSAWLACHHTVGSLWQSLYEGDSSELQMVLYNIYLWTWVHLFGRGEYVLRLSNLPFACLLVASFATACRLAFRRSFAWLPIAASPFLWFFMNEARAYLPMMACASASLSALLVYTYADPLYRRVAAWLCIAFFTASLLLHMMAGLLGPPLLTIALMEWRRKPGDWKRDWLRPVLFLGPLLAAACAYILWTISRGLDVDYGPPNLLEFVYNVYKFLGLWSLGPGNSAMPGGAHIWYSYAAPLLAGVITLACALARPLKGPARVLLLALTSGFLFSVLLSIAVHKPLAARHLSALVPVLLFFVVLQAAGRWRLACLTAVWLMACVRLVSLPEYGKDDYRSATHAAIELAARDSAVIVWAADPLTASYYGLRLQDPLHPPVYFFDYTRGVRRVDWPVLATGTLASEFNSAQAAAVIEANRKQNRPMVLVLPTRIPFSRVSLVQGALPAVEMARTSWSSYLENQQPAASFQLLSLYRLK